MMQKLKTRMKVGKQGWQRSLPLSDDGICRITVVGCGATAHALLGMLAIAPSNTPIHINILCTAEDASKLDKFQTAFKEHGGIVLHHAQDEERQHIHLAFPESILPGKHAFPKIISSDPKSVIPGSNIIFFTQSTLADSEWFGKIKTHLDEKVWIGHLATKGFEEVIFRNAIGEDSMKHMTFFGVSETPWFSEIEEFGRSVKILGTLKKVGVACLPSKNSSSVTKVLQGIIDPDEEMCKFEPDYSFLGISLGVVGMVSVLMEAAERNFEQGTTPNTINTIDFDACSKLMEISSEVQQVTKKLSDDYSHLNLSGSSHIIDWWNEKFGVQARDPATFVRLFKSNPALSRLQLACTEDADSKESLGAGKQQLKFRERLLKEEVCNSLMPVKGLAEFLGVETPRLDETIRWGQEKLDMEFLVRSSKAVGAAAATSPTEGKRTSLEYKCLGKDLKKSRAPQALGAKSVDDFLTANYYLKQRHRTTTVQH